MSHIDEEVTMEIQDNAPLWGLDIEEITGRSIETKGREDVNQLLQQGWILLHIYTLKYKEDDTWRERPMAILGRPTTARSFAAPH